MGTSNLGPMLCFFKYFRGKKMEKGGNFDSIGTIYAEKDTLIFKKIGNIISENRHYDFHLGPIYELGKKNLAKVIIVNFDS
jgi:hypothetical protein